jgi:hypothetical protein
MTAYRTYTIDTHGYRTLKSEFADTNDREALRVALEAVRRFPAERTWLLECDPNYAQVGEQSYLIGDSADRYEEPNIFGAPTGKVIHAAEGEPPPVVPRGFTWRRIMPEEC